MEVYRKRGISGSTLKMIAMVAMLIDHVGAVILEPMLIQSGYSHALYETDMFMRLVIGRMAFPIFCFLLVEGMRTTSNIYRYGFRLLVFALISEVPFDLALNGVWIVWDHQNVMFTLLIGLAVTSLSCKAEEVLKNVIMKAIAELAVLVAGMLLADVLRADYGSYGVLCIAVLYYFRRDRGGQLLAGTIAFVAGDYLLNGSTSELVAPLALLAATCYNGERGMKLKYLFYAFYPAHLLVLYGVRILLI